MKKLKVFGGNIFRKGKQVRAIIAANSQKKVAEITNLSLNEIRGWWSETGNEKELKTALAKPYTIFIRQLYDYNGEYKETL